MVISRPIIILLSAFVVAVTTMTAPLVLAQSSATPPTPGSVISPIDTPVVQPAPIQPPSITRDEGNKLTPPSSDKRIPVNQFKLVGNSLFEDSVLLGIIGDYFGAPITIEEIYQAADDIQRFYRSRGYLLASVYVPAQKISSGTVRLEIIEGRLASVHIEDAIDSYTPRFLIDYFDTSNLGDVISRSLLDEKITKLNDLPGLTARAVILPGSEYGTSDIAIQAIEERSSLTLRINNYGRKSLGETRLEAGWLYVNPFSQGDQLNLSAIIAENSRMTFLRADYDALVSSSGTRAGVGISMFNYDVNTEEINLSGGLEGDGNNFRMFVSQPILRRQRNKLDISAIFRVNETSESGSLAISNETRSIDILDLSLNWQSSHDSGAFSSFTTTFSSNFKDNPDGTEIDALKSKLTFDYSLLKPFSQTWFAQLAVNLVASDDPLPDVERYRLGGPGNIRAYPSAELAGDKGGMFGVDLGRRFNISGSLDMVVKLFADSGKVKRIIPVAGEKSEESLSGYGAGILVNFGKRHSLEIDVAKTTSNLDSSDERDSRIWLNYSARI